MARGGISRDVRQILKSTFLFRGLCIAVPVDVDTPLNNACLPIMLRHDLCVTPNSTSECCLLLTQICELMFYNGKVISVDPPQFVDLEVGSLSDSGPGLGLDLLLAIIIYFLSLASICHKLCFYFAIRQITETPPGVKGNTASGAGSKSATLETGAVVSVPSFLEV